MIRRFAMLILIAGASAVAVGAQTQSHPQHPPGKPHNRPDHVPLDPAVHAAMHARLLGTWSGTLTSTGSDPSHVQLAISHDKHGNMAINIHGNRQEKAVPANDVSIDEHGLHWTQDVAGAPCKATAAFDPAMHHAPETLKGTMTCGHRLIAFNAHKTKG